MHGPGARLEEHLKGLGLSDAQQQKVHAILDGAKATREANRARMKQAFQDMRALLDQDQPDRSKVLAQADVIGQITTEAHKRMLQTLLDVRAELTPEQRTKLREDLQKHGPMGRWHRHHRGGMGSGGMGGPPPEPPPADAPKGN